MVPNRSITIKFLQVFRYAIDEHTPVPQIDAQEWEELFEMGKNQAVLGVLLDAVLRMGKGVAIPRQLKMKWFFMSKK